MKSSCPISISNNNCVDCYRCVRDCEVKAINFNQMQAQINSDKCIVCGACIDICPSSVIISDSDLSKVKRAIKNNDIIIASLSPGWVAEFKDIAPYRIIEALRLLGFTHVSETALGASLLCEENARIFSSTDQFLISNACPVTTKLITSHFPSLTDKLISTVPPAMAHARMLKEIYGNEAVVVAIDSCIASKTFSAIEDSSVYAALTFNELQEWMEESSVTFDRIPGNENYHFEPFESTSNNLFIIPRGVYNHSFLKNYNLGSHVIYNYSGVARIKNILESILKEDAPKNTFLELFACKEGCLSGAGCIDSLNLMTKRSILSRYEQEEQKLDISKFPSVELFHQYKPNYVKPYVSEDEISDSYDTLFFKQGEELINCGGCGFADCRSFAKALASGETVPEMCSYYLKEVAQNRFTMLLGKLYAGVAIVDENLQITEANQSFANMFGADSKLMFDSNPGMAGVPLIAMFPAYLDVKDVLKHGYEFTTKELEVKGKMVNLIIFTLQKNKSVCILARNMFSGGSTSTEESARRIQNLINDNLETVQKIAYLLGDNASKTEAVLNSIIDSQIIR